jgi:uncharacterized protein YggT (Ycf19 family)
MKKFYVIISFLLLVVLGSTNTIDAWITFDETPGNFFHELLFPVKPNQTYDVFINPDIPARGGVAQLDNLRHVIGNEQSSFRFRDASFNNLGEITTQNVFNLDGPSFRPTGYGSFTTPNNAAWVLVRLGTISTTSSTPTQAQERNNLVGNFTIFERGALNEVIISGSSVFINQAYNEGFSDGLNNATGTAVNALTAFIPQMLGVTFAFFFTVLSFEVLGVSALSIIGTLLAISVAIITFKLFLGR